MIWPTNVTSLPDTKFNVTVYRKEEFSDAQVVDADAVGFVEDAYCIRKGLTKWFYPMSTVSWIKVEEHV